jgi:DNA invertase Pin-like site-specific DNA recombinase
MNSSTATGKPRAALGGKPRAYSYLRFSTPEQSQGDSFRRQTEASERYATQHGLDLDTKTTFRDLGVSAFRGRNVKEGALGQFIAAVEAGSIQPGSFLLVESLDRLSRQTVNRAFLQFQSIVDQGINVVTLQDGKIYSRETLEENFGDLMVSLAVMFRANEESATKSKRLKAAWTAKRKKAVEGTHKLTSICPAWLTLDRGKGTFVVLKDRAKVVRRIFDMTLGGHGKATIAQAFNREGVPVFGRSEQGWHPSYIQKILDNDAVHGVFHPHRLDVSSGRRKRVPDGEPVEGYYPAVVSRETFLQARRLRQGRKIDSGRKGVRFSNLFTGIAKCGHCGAPMHYVNKGAGRKGGTFLICSNARRAASNCNNRPWRYGSAEKFILLGLQEVDYRELFPEVHRSVREKLDGLARARVVKEADMEAAKHQTDNILGLLAERPDSPSFKRKLEELEQIQAALAMELQALADEMDEEEARMRNVEQGQQETQGILAQLAKGLRGDQAKVFDLRSRLHQLLKRTLYGIQFKPATHGQHEEDAPALHGEIKVTFAGTNSYRWMLRVEEGQKRCAVYQESQEKLVMVRAVEVFKKKPV